MLYVRQRRHADAESLFRETGAILEATLGPEHPLLAQNLVDLARFQPPVFERRVTLDELGTFVLRQIDGRRSTRAIVDGFAARYQVSRRQAELSCVEFIRSLAARQVISILIK